MNSDQELIFNLFIMEFCGLSVEFFTEEDCLFTTNNPLNSYHVIKDCFPVNEVCTTELFHKENKVYPKTINWIKE